MESKDWFNDVLLAFLAILPVVNPFSKPPIFLSITEGWSVAERRNEAFKASIYAFIILLVSLVAGTFVYTPAAGAVNLFIAWQDALSARPFVRDQRGDATIR